MTDVSPTPADRLQISTDADADPITFVLEGELDPHTSPMLQSHIDDTLAGRRGRSGARLRAP